MWAIGGDRWLAICALACWRCALWLMAEGGPVLDAGPCPDGAGLASAAGEPFVRSA